MLGAGPSDVEFEEGQLSLEGELVEEVVALVIGDFGEAEGGVRVENAFDLGHSAGIEESSHYLLHTTLHHQLTIIIVSRNLAPTLPLKGVLDRHQS